MDTAERKVIPTRSTIQLVLMRWHGVFKPISQLQAAVPTTVAMLRRTE